MSKVNLNQLVRTKSGEVATIAALDERDQITFEEVKGFSPGRGAKPRTAYFATMPDGGCWEIGRLAYLSRTGQKVSF